MTRVHVVNMDSPACAAVSTRHQPTAMGTRTPRGLPNGEGARGARSTPWVAVPAALPSCWDEADALFNSNVIAHEARWQLAAHTRTHSATWTRRTRPWSLH